MKIKIIILSLIISFTFFSCKKDNAEPEVKLQRGKVLKFNTIQQFKKQDILQLIMLFYPTLLGQITVSHDVDFVYVEYATINPDDTETKASGLLAIPKGLTGGAAILNFNHGTILKKNDVPSQKGTGSEVGTLLGGEGYVVVLPDFLGLGNGTGLHPYMHAQSEATCVIDMLRASKKVCDSLGVALNGQLFLMGYSQGGHVTLATQKLIEEQYNTEFQITAVAGMAGPYDVSGIQTDIILKDSIYSSPGYLPYMLYSYNSVYKMFNNLSDVFVSPYNTSLSMYFDGNNAYNLSEVEAILPTSKIPNAILKTEILQQLKENTSHPLRLALKTNDLCDWKPKTQIHLYHCDGDIHVPAGNSLKAYNRFIELGFTTVELINPLSGGTHTTCVIPSIIEAKNWFNTLRN